MAKDAYYFSHDSNAKDDPKCMLVIDQLGLEGYGIFWVLVEVLRDQTGYKYPISLLPVLARRYNTSAEKMLAVVKKYDLFQLDERENFFSLSLHRRMEKLDQNRKQRRLAGIRSGEVRKENANKRLSNGRSTSVQRLLNKNEQSKVKKSKEKKNTYKPETLRVFEDVIPFFQDHAPKTETLKEVWLDTIEKLHRIDGYSFQQIQDVITWARSDEFWMKNFRSVKKLRQKDGQDTPYIKVFLGHMNSKKKSISHHSDYQPGKMFM